MKRSILLTGILPPRLTYFADPPAAPTAPDPTVNGGEQNAELNADILNFTPPDVEGVVNDVLDQKPDDPAKPPPDPTKPPEPAKPPTDPAKPPNGDPPAKQLREELDRLKTELATAKDTLTKGDPRIKELEAERDRVKGELAERDTKLSEYEKKLALADPAVRKQLDDMDVAYNKDAGKFYGSVPEITQQAVEGLVTEFHQLPWGKPEYREARAAWELKVNAALGAQEGSEHRKLERTIEFIEKTHEFAVERPKVERQVNESALDRKKAYMSEEHGKGVTFVKNAINKWSAVPEGLEARDPLHPVVMMDKFFQAMPEEQRNSYTKGIPEFLELAMAGPKPMDPTEVAGMTPEQVKETMQRQNSKYEKSREDLVSVAYNGMKALRLFPTLMKEVMRLREKLGEEVDNTPPDPTKAAPDAKDGQGDDDVRTFAPPDLSKVNIG